MRNETIIERSNGDKVKIMAHAFYSDTTGQMNYNIEVYIQEKGKRKYRPGVNTDNWDYRKLEMAQRKLYEDEQNLGIVTKEEINKAKDSLWHKMRPTLLTILLAIFLPALIYAQIPTRQLNTYVNDFAGVLNPAQIKELNDSILSIEKKSSVQLAVVIINKLPGMDIAEYALQVGRKWHVGKADNGLVYVLATEDHKQRLEVANNVQGDIPDFEAESILEDAKALLHNKDYFGALQTIISDISDDLDPAIIEQKAIEKAARQKDYEKAVVILKIIGLWILVLALAAWALWLILGRKIYKARKLAREQEYFEENKRRWALRTEETLKRQREYTERINAPGYVPPVPYIAPIDDDHNYKSSSSSDDSLSPSSSDYGNFGGGSSDSGFSGGGASGDF